MTIVTKPLTDKKQDQLKKPLVAAGEVLPGESTIVDCPDDPTYVIQSRPRTAATTILYVFLISLIVFGIGVLGGLYLYRQLGRQQQHNKVKGWFHVPQSREKFPESSQLMSFGDDLAVNRQPYKSGLKEEFEIDMESDYANINVPNFNYGRKGRFIHDFNANKTGIVDEEGNRCFVLPLNRATVLPPKSMFDLINKIWSGYYEVDTEVIRETYRVDFPPITSVEEMGRFIYKECNEMPTYRLRLVTDRLFKRSLAESELFSEFAGKKVTEFRIITDGLLEYERDQKSSP